MGLPSGSGVCAPAQRGATTHHACTPAAARSAALAAKQAEYRRRCELYGRSGAALPPKPRRSYAAAAQQLGGSVANGSSSGTCVRVVQTFVAAQRVISPCAVCSALAASSITIRSDDPNATLLLRAKQHEVLQAARQRGTRREESRSQWAAQDTTPFEERMCDAARRGVTHFCC